MESTDTGAVDDPKQPLITIEQIDAPAIFGEGETEKILAFIRAQVQPLLEEVPDLETEKGRKVLKSAAYRVRRSKTMLDEIGKEFAAKLKKTVSQIDGNRRKVRDTLDALCDEVRAPVTKWEEAKAARDAEIEANIRKIIDAGETVDGSSDDLRAVLAETEAITLDTESFGDRQGDAALYKDIAVNNLKNAVADAEKREADAAELEKLREEKEQREAKEKADREKREAAEAAAQAEREKAERIQRNIDDLGAFANDLDNLSPQLLRERRNDLQITYESGGYGDQADRAAAAFRQADQHIVRAIKAAEDREEREAAERAAEERRRKQEKEREEAERRAADQAHRVKVNQEARAAILQWSDLSEDQATSIVTMIAAGRVPHIEIKY